MPAIGYLLCVRSAFFDRLRICAGSVSTHEVHLRMRFQPGNDGRRFAIRQQINRTVALQIHQDSAITLAFFQRKVVYSQHMW